MLARRPLGTWESCVSSADIAALPVEAGSYLCSGDGASARAFDCTTAESFQDRMTGVSAAVAMDIAEAVDVPAYGSSSRSPPSQPRAEWLCPYWRQQSRRHSFVRTSALGAREFLQLRKLTL